MERQHVIKQGLESRRHLLKMAGGCAALTNTSLLSTILNLSATNAAVAQSGDLTDYKAVVCLFLFGGNDSYNTLSPLTGNDQSGERADYLDGRGGVYAVGNGALGLPASDLHSISDLSGRTFGLHPELGDLKTLYDAGKLTFVSNVGSLVQPTTMAEYDSGSSLPLGLFSHADLQRHWMTSVPQTRSQVTGWAGRMADLLTNQTNNNDAISMNISLNDVNMLQTGSGVVPYVIRDSGAQEVSWYSKEPSNWHYRKMFSELTDDVLSRSYGNLLERTFAQQGRTALDAAIGFNEAKNSVSDFEEQFTIIPGQNSLERLQRQFRMIAKTIAARDMIDQKRQIFFVGLGGFDNHDELIVNHTGTMRSVNHALANFQAAIDSMGMTNNVLTFTASDFARTLNSNGRGSDHGWGGNQIVMGGPVNGGQIHGQYPTSLARGADLDLDRGRFLPTTSVDEMAAEIAMWYGIDNDSNLEQVLPNIRNFDSANTGKHPVGFLS